METIRDEHTANIDKFIQSKQSESEEETIRFTLQLIELKKQMVEISKEIQVISKDAKDNGVDTSKVTKNVNDLIARMKAKPEDLIIADSIKSTIENSDQVLEAVNDLVRASK